MDLKDIYVRARILGLKTGMVKPYLTHEQEEKYGRFLDSKLNTQSPDFLMDRREFLIKQLKEGCLEKVKKEKNSSK